MDLFILKMTYLLQYLTRLFDLVELGFVGKKAASMGLPRHVFMNIYQTAVFKNTCINPDQID